MNDKPVYSRPVYEIIPVVGESLSPGECVLLRNSRIGCYRKLDKSELEALGFLVLNQDWSQSTGEGEVTRVALERLQHVRDAHKLQSTDNPKT